jgi:cytidine deaminase
VVSDEALVARALAVRKHAWAPYSRFAVGAAVLTADGEVFVGVNVESASYPLTCCAERVAMYAAVSAGKSEIRVVAVVTDTTPPARPCGACRQVIRELGPDARVLCAGVDGRWEEAHIRTLLPDAFDGSALRGR